MKRFLVIFFVLIFVSSVYGACTPGAITTGSCNSDCDGIKIEDKCYDCGDNDDGVCPRDFDVNCDSYPDCDCDIDKTKPECGGAAVGCELISAKWSKDTSGTSIATVTENIKVYLQVTTENCKGASLSFKVFEDDTWIDSAVNTIPNSIVVGDNNIVYSEWIAEWQDDGVLQGEPEYYFRVTAGTITKYSGNLEVTKSAGGVAVSDCGNGIIDPGEDCDFDSLGSAILPKNPDTDEVYDCKALGFTSGNLGCISKTETNGCTVDLTDCSGEGTAAVLTCADFGLVGGEITLDSDGYPDTSDCFASDFCDGVTDCSSLTQGDCVDGGGACGLTCGWDSGACAVATIGCGSGEYTDAPNTCVTAEGNYYCSPDSCDEVTCDFSTDCNNCAGGTYTTGCEEDCATMCSSYTPSQDVSYQEPEGPWPWYDFWELIITSLILIGYYSILHKRLVK